VLLRIWLFLATFFILACSCGTGTTFESGLDSGFTDSGLFPTDSGQDTYDSAGPDDSGDSGDSGTGPEPAGCKTPSAGEPSDVVCDETCWCWDHPQPGGGSLSGVWGTSADDVWFTGVEGALLHWDGEALTAHDAPYSVTEEIAGLDGRLYVADGWDVQERDGDTWTLHEDVLDQGNLVDVATIGDSQVWVVGYDRVDSAYQPRAAWTDGSTWTRVDPTGLEDDYLTAVAGPSIDDVYAGTNEGQVLHYDGAEWSLVGEPGDGSHIEAVSISAEGTLWVASSQRVYTWDGGAFVEQSYIGLIADLHADTDDNVWVLGWDELHHFDGATWTVTSLGDAWMHQLWGAPTGEAFAVGDNDLRLADADGVTQLLGAAGDSEDTWGLYVGDDDDGWSLIDGQLLRYQGDTWTSARQTPASVSTLYAIHGSATDNVWLMGVAAHHWDGSGWTEEDLPGGAIRCVWVASTTEAWAMNADGDAVHWNGTDWSVIELGLSWRARDIWGTTDGHVWAAGNDGNLVHWEGSTWTEYNTGVTSDYYGVWTHDGETLYLVTPNSAAVWSWTAAGGLVEEVDLFIYNPMAVRGTGPDDIWAAGSFSNGTHFDGATWTDVEPEINGVSTTTTHISIAPSGRIWFAGDDRLILTHTPE
jgi:hypothetical protein